MSRLPAPSTSRVKISRSRSLKFGGGTLDPTCAVDPAELVVHRGVVDRDRGVAPHRVEAAQPFLVRLARGAAEQLERADGLVAYREGDRHIGFQALASHQGATVLPHPVNGRGGVNASFEQ